MPRQGCNKTERLVPRFGNAVVFTRTVSPAEAGVQRNTGFRPPPERCLDPGLCLKIPRPGLASFPGSCLGMPVFRAPARSWWDGHLARHRQAGRLSHRAFFMVSYDRPIMEVRRGDGGQSPPYSVVGPAFRGVNDERDARPTNTGNARPYL